MKRIYFDNAATTPVDERVLKAMLPFLKKDFGNPHSVHSFGQAAQKAVDQARDKIAAYLHCEPAEIIFTSGATESNNLAIQGVVNQLIKNNKPIHIVTTKIEHPSVLEVFQALEKAGKARATYLPVDRDGLVSVEKLKAAITSETVLISIMYANNEMGAIQPIGEIVQTLKQIRQGRGENGLPLYFHVDAVQAFNYLDCDVNKLDVDLLSFSGHKIYGPKGVGALYIRRGVKIQPLAQGGHQEYNLRPGTLNVPGIVGLGTAVSLVASEQKKTIKRLEKIKAQIMKDLQKITEIRFNGSIDKQLPNIINVSFYKAEGESILMMLDLAGIAVSTGSACSSGSLEPSHVLMAMGVTPEWSHGSIRISLGKFNAETEVDVFTKKIGPIIKKLREMAP